MFLLVRSTVRSIPAPARSFELPDRLFVQSFALVEPWWTVRTRSVPYWAAFNTDSDVAALEDSLERVDPYDEIVANLFAHGVESAGLASVDRWRDVLGHARTDYGFVGVDETEVPYDIESHVRYHEDIPNEIETRRPNLSPMRFDRFESIASAAGDADEYAIEWDRPRSEIEVRD